jgi:hypothetical protein
MENFAAETIADRELRVDNENNAVFQALPICPPGQIDRGILTTFDAKALNAERRLVLSSTPSTTSTT